MKNDFELKTDVLNRLELEPKIDAAALGVSVENGVVTLKGSMETEADRLNAERVVRDVAGVKGLVDDELEVESRLRSRPADSELQKAAVESLQWLVTVPPESISITVRNGWLKVEGEVEFRHQAQSVESVLREIHGLRGIRNELTVGTHSQAA